MVVGKLHRHSVLELAVGWQGAWFVEVTIFLDLRPHNIDGLPAVMQYWPLIAAEKSASNVALIEQHPRHSRDHHNTQ